MTYTFKNTFAYAFSAFFTGRFTSYRYFGFYSCEKMIASGFWA